jgi:two-component system response regulator HydG
MIFANHFLRITNRELGKQLRGFTFEVEDILKNYIWYGNLRELKNVVKRAALLTDGFFIEAKTLPFEINNFNKLLFEEPLENRGDASHELQNSFLPESLDAKMRSANIEAEHRIILEALEQTNYNKSKAAQLLNIDRKTLYNKMKQFRELNALLK